ncbi:MAG TPA: class I SAM-dependent methyltransferase [Magnetococcales bacterium]|nr:class I SAM-dependent methyltransferase [Magnetococcales bacterium]
MSPFIPAFQPCIWLADASATEKASLWSKRLGLPIVDHIDHTPLPLLVIHQGRLELRLGNARQKGVYCEFSIAKAQNIQRQEGKKSLLARAIGLGKIPSPNVLDATAGLGQDSFLLAFHGCRVQLFERSPIVAALLEDGMQRALTHPQTQTIVQQRMQLHMADADAFMQHPPNGPRTDCVYLDPMFTKSNHSALAKKEMQMLRLLVGQDEDAPRLLQTAIAYGRQRIVVKRPLKAPPLEGPAPHFSIQGTTIRYDVYLPEVA